MHSKCMIADMVRLPLAPNVMALPFAELQGESRDAEERRGCGGCAADGED